MNEFLCENGRENRENRARCVYREIIYDIERESIPPSRVEREIMFKVQRAGGGKLSVITLTSVRQSDELSKWSIENKLSFPTTSLPATWDS